jgi:hypothetical protein
VALLFQPLTVQEWQSASQDWHLDEINNVMSLLIQKKQHLEHGTKVSEKRLLKNFLEEVRTRKQNVRFKVIFINWSDFVINKAILVYIADINIIYRSVVVILRFTLGVCSLPLLC